MRGFLAAILFSILIHAAVFLIITPDFLQSDKLTRPENFSVSVSLSYKEPKPSQKPVKKKPPKKQITQEKAIPDPVETPVNEQPVEQVDDAQPEEDAETGPQGEEESANVTLKASPLYRNNPDPPYPKVAQIKGYQGTTMLEVLVNEHGRVEKMRIFTSSGYAMLDKSAMKGVEKWEFIPGQKGDKKVSMWIRLPVTFHLE